MRQYERKWIISFLIQFIIGIGLIPTYAHGIEINLDSHLMGTHEFTLEVISVASQEKHQGKIYIYHTHTYEAYKMDEENNYIPTEAWRTADARYNVVRIGEELANALRAAGFYVTHDTTAYEPPKLSTAYARSLEGLPRSAPCRQISFSVNSLFRYCQHHLSKTQI